MHGGLHHTIAFYTLQSVVIPDRSVSPSIEKTVRMDDHPLDESVQLTDEEENDDLAQEPSASSDTLVKKARLVKTKPFSNPIHQWFVDSGKGSKCLICSKTKPYRNPSNLKSHLKSQHPREFKEFLQEEAKLAAAKELKKKTTSTSASASASASGNEEQNRTITDCFRQISERRDILKKGSDGYEKAIRSIAAAFICCSLPTRLIEDKFIRRMFETISNGRLVSFPHRREFSAKIEQLTSELKSRLSFALHSAKFVSLTVDLWSRPGYSSALMGVTCHFFCPKTNGVVRLLLTCRTIKQPHTGANIYELYESVLKEWQLEESKILRIITDNGSNIVKAFKHCLLTLVEEREIQMEDAGVSNVDPHLEDSFVFEDEDMEDREVTEFDSREAEFDGQFYRKQRISCFAHNMMLAVKTAVDNSKVVDAAKKRAHTLIATVSNSPKAMEMLRQRTGGIGLIKPVTTRWIYWFYVFDRLIKVKRNLSDVCDELNIIHDLGPAEWKIITQIRDLLEPFAAAVTRLEGEHYATISEVYPILFSLKEKLQQFRQQTVQTSPIFRVIRKLETELDERFKRVMVTTDASFDPIYATATFLDPRYALLLEGVLLEEAKKELRRMAAFYVPPTDGSGPGSQNNDDRLIETSDTGLFAAALSKIRQKRQSNLTAAPGSAIDQECEVYLSSLKSTDASSEDPFGYWSKQSGMFPIIRGVAFDILSVPATSAPAERVFSRASYILDRKRHNMDDKKLESELFFKVNVEYLGIP